MNLNTGNLLPEEGVPAEWSLAQIEACCRNVGQLQDILAQIYRCRLLALPESEYHEARRLCNWLEEQE